MPPDPVPPDPAPPDTFVVRFTARAGQRDRTGFPRPPADVRLAKLFKHARALGFRAEWARVPAGVELTETEPDAEVKA